MDHWIVVVDDDAMSLASVRNMLSEENMHVSCMRSGIALLKFLEKNTPDLILLDVIMPDMDGFETYHALRKLEDKSGRPHVPVIFITGENDSAVEQKGLDIGASDFIRKPINKEIIVRRIDNTILNRKTIETLTDEAMIDGLTGLLNKDRVTERVSKLCGRKSGSLMIMDLDNFKLVNDLFGHDMGDRVLLSFANIARNNTRETDTIGRIGGDEFLAFYEELMDEGAVASLALRLNSQLHEEAVKLMGEDHGIPLGISIGVVMVPEQGRDYESLFAMADGALYSVKQNGKHGYSIYTQANDPEHNDEIGLKQKLARMMRIVEERNDQSGALILGGDSFTLVYRFIIRFYKRYGGTATLILFNLFTDENDNSGLTEASIQFSVILQKTLRLSDLITQNGANSFFVMLTERTKAEADGAIKRVMNAWEDTAHKDNVSIEYVYTYINDSGEKQE